MTKEQMIALMVPVLLQGYSKGEQRRIDFAIVDAEEIWQRVLDKSV